MKKLVKYLVESITGSSEFEIEEIKNEGGTEYVIHAEDNLIGLIIGKGGATIKSIRNIVKIKATLQKTHVNVSVEEKGTSS